MNKKLIGAVAMFLLSSSMLIGQKNKIYEIKSPGGNINLHIEAGAKLEWSVQSDGQQVIAPSSISLQLTGGEVLGENVKVLSTKTDKIDNVITAVNYKKSTIKDQCNQFTINLKGDYGLIFSCLLYTSPSPRDGLLSRMPSS